MPLNTFKCNCLTSLHFKGLKNEDRQTKLYWRDLASLCVQLASSRDLLQLTRPLQTNDGCTQTPSPQSYCDVKSHPTDPIFTHITYTHNT